MAIRAREELGKVKGDAFAAGFNTVVYAGDADVEWWTKTKDSKKSMEVSDGIKTGEKVLNQVIHKSIYYSRGYPPSQNSSAKVRPALSVCGLLFW